jgi:hypothetical protein
MKFVESKTALTAGAAASKIAGLIEAEMAATGYPHAYTGALNNAFTRAGGSLAEYRAGRDHGIAEGLFTVDDSGSRIKLGRHGIGWKRPPGY